MTQLCMKLARQEDEECGVGPSHLAAGESGHRRVVNHGEVRPICWRSQADVATMRTLAGGCRSFDLGEALAFPLSPGTRFGMHSLFSTR